MAEGQIGVDVSTGKAPRIGIDGRHLQKSGRPYHARGVTYGSFQPRFDGSPFPERSVIKRDLDDIARVGLNTVRTYEVPPSDLFEAAEEFDLRAIVGLHYHDWRLESHP